VKVFQLIGNVWTQMGSTITAESGDALGFSIDLSDDGTTLVAGARFSDLNGFNAGRAYVFRFAQGAWSLVNSAVSGEATGDQFGRSVSVSSDGSVWAAGASGNSAGGADAGHVRVFEDALSVGLPRTGGTGRFILFPNPAADRVVIQGEDEIISYTIHTPDGKVIAQENVNFRKEFQLSVAGFEQGTYFVRLQGPDHDHFLTLLKH
jgi:hypothetical protein